MKELERTDPCLAHIWHTSKERQIRQVHREKWSHCHLRQYSLMRPKKVVTWTSRYYISASQTMSDIHPHHPHHRLMTPTLTNDDLDHSRPPRVATTLLWQRKHQVLYLCAGGCKRSLRDASTCPNAAMASFCASLHSALCGGSC